MFPLAATDQLPTNMPTIGRRKSTDYAGQFLTVVTYGRTGSTALQASLNALPGVLIRGEHYSALRGIQAYAQSVAETADRHHAGRPEHPWFGSARLDPSATLADLRRHVVTHLLRPRADTRWLGFKEVRYEPGHFANYDLLLDHLLFLGRLLPGLVYLMNVRDPKTAAASGWWPNHGDAEAVLTTTRDWLIQAASDINGVTRACEQQPRAIVLQYEQWSQDPQVLLDAYARLGLPRDDEAVRSALGTRLEHGSHAAPPPAGGSA